MSFAGAVGAAPRRRITSQWWHQGPTRHPLTSCADPTRSAGRYHRPGGPGVRYASSQEQAAWAELFRHFIEVGIDPFEVRRRVGRVTVNLDVLDLTDQQLRERLGINESDLVSDDYTITRDLAEAAQKAGLDAISAPAAALPGRQTLAVFARALPKVHAERSEVRQPSPRLVDLLPVIRPHERVPDAIRRMLRTMAKAGAEAVRRRA